jgi:thiaminase/transcriptional activator TenA
MRDELSAIAGPVLAQVLEHPFWAGLRDGTLPADLLWYFAEQDARYVVPAYARALARTAALTENDAHAALLCSAADATFGSLPRLSRELAKLAETLGRPPAPAASGQAAPIRAHTSFMLAAPTMSFAAATGGLLPMTWFHLHVSTDLERRHAPGSRYASWIDQYLPHDSYQDYVEAYLSMIDQVGELCSAGERDQLIGCFEDGARYEWAFAEAAWRQRE